MSYRNEENEDINRTGPLSFYQKLKARWSLWEPSPAFALKFIILLSGVIFLSYTIFQNERIICWFEVLAFTFKFIGVVSAIFSFLISIQCLLDEGVEDLRLFSLCSVCGFILSVILLYLGFIVFENKHLEVVKRQNRLYAPYENAMEEINPERKEPSCD